MVTPIPFPIKSSVSNFRLYSVFLASFCLPPIGLWWAIKYLRSPEARLRKAGIIIILLTVISSVLTTYSIMGLVSGLNSTVQEQKQIMDFEY